LRWSSRARIALPKSGEATVSIERIGREESRLDMWLLTMNSDLGDREVRELVDTMRAVRERVARARDYA
jgi:hypothetical protein